MCTTSEWQDPLVRIREQELAIRAAESQRRAEQDQAELDLEKAKATAKSYYRCS